MENKTRYDVFISYSTIDKRIAEGVCGFLESHRIRCFVAYRDIPKGEDWAHAIPPALRDSKMMLAVFSKAFNVSDQTDNELHIASHRKIPVLTFRITDDEFDGAKEYFLTKSNWIDAFPEPEKQFGELLKSIELLLNIKGESHASIVAPQVEVKKTAAVESACDEAMRLLYNDKEHRDPLKATYLLRKSAKDESPEAEYHLALCYLNGWGVAQSWTQAHEWLTKASEHGHLKAKYELGRMCHYAIGCKQNIMQALSLYNEAAEGGCGEAAKMLGIVYHTGELGVQAEDRSNEWYERALELLQDAIFEKNDSDAMRTLAISYMDGEGVERDYALAVEWLKKAAELNNAAAMNTLYLCYDEGYGVLKNPDVAIDWLKKAADLDSRVAQSNLSNHYEAIDDIEKSRFFIQKAANGGYGSAQSSIATRYLLGDKLFNQDVRQAEFWYKKAIESGSLVAMVNYAINLQNNENCTGEDLAQSVAYAKKAAMLNYYPAYQFLATSYYVGKGVDQTDTEAERWYRRIVDIYEEMQSQCLETLWYPVGQGTKQSICFKDEYWRNMLIQACEYLVYIYRNSKSVKHDEDEAKRLEAMLKGVKPEMEYKEWSDKGDNYYYGRNGVTQDYAEAMKWYLKAAEKGYDYAQNQLGNMYMDGSGVEVDYEEALRWYQKSADQGNAYGIMSIGIYYHVVKDDTQEAVKWYQQAAEKGLAQSQANLGNCYYNGDGVAQNYTEAVKWYKKAVEQENAFAQCYLGTCYEQGHGVQKNLLEAKEWYQKAADQGLESAKTQLEKLVKLLANTAAPVLNNSELSAQEWYNKGEDYYYGRNGLSQDYKEAVNCYRKSAELGLPSAQNDLGFCYNNGYGVQKDFVEAVKWYREAAELDYVSAQYNMGWIYEHAQGVEKNISEAKKWYQKAADKGHEDAIKRLQNLSC